MTHGPLQSVGSWMVSALIKKRLLTSKSHQPCLSHSLSQKCFSDHFLVLLEHLWESDSSCHWEVYIRDRQPHQKERPSPGLNGRCDVWCPVCDCVPWPQRWVSVSRVAWEKDTGSPPRPPTHPPLERVSYEIFWGPGLKSRFPMTCNLQFHFGQ